MSVYRKRRPGAWNGEIGPVLAEARQSKGLSLKEAERYTSIRARYLEGLEQENPAELPDKGYVQGFLDSYAEFLGLDAEELGRRFKRFNRHTGGRRQRRENGEGPPASPDVVPRTGRWRPGVGALLALSLALLALALIAAFYIFGRDPLFTTVPGNYLPAGGERGDEQGGPPPEEGGGDGVPAVEGEPTLEESPGAQADGREESLEVRVLVRGSESWILVESDSGVEYTGIAQPGFSRSFESGRSLRITTGNAGAVRMEINGQEYGDLGEDGEVTSRSFTLKRER